MEKLSEQLAFNRIPFVTANNSSSTAMVSEDMYDNHAVIAHALVDWTATAGTANVKAVLAIQASTTSTFATPTTITSSSFQIGNVAAAGSASATLSAIAEDVQAARAAEDRYVRAVLTLTSGAASHTVYGTGDLIANRSRFKPTA